VQQIGRITNTIFQPPITPLDIGKACREENNLSYAGKVGANIMGTLMQGLGTIAHNQHQIIIIERMFVSHLFVFLFFFSNVW
jgi:hypothetical protein